MSTATRYVPIIFTSQMAIDHWCHTIGNQRLDDAIPDGLAHNAYRIKLGGESLRKHQQFPVPRLTTLLQIVADPLQAR